MSKPPSGEKENADHGYGTIDDRTKLNIRRLEEAEINAEEGRDFLPNKLLSNAQAGVLDPQHLDPIDKEMLAVRTFSGRSAPAGTSRKILAGVVDPDTGKLWPEPQTKRKTRSGVVGPGYRYHWDKELETLRDGAGWNTGRPFAAVGTGVSGNSPFGTLDPENSAALLAAGYDPTQYGHPPAPPDGLIQSVEKAIVPADEVDRTCTLLRRDLNGGKRKKSRRRTKKKRPRRKTRAKRSNRKRRTRRR